MILLNTANLINKSNHNDKDVIEYRLSKQRSAFVCFANLTESGVLNFQTLQSELESHKT